MLARYTQARKVVRDNWGPMSWIVAFNTLDRQTGWWHNTQPDEPDDGAIPFFTQHDKRAFSAT